MRKNEELNEMNQSLKNIKYFQDYKSSSFCDPQQQKNMEEFKFLKKQKEDSFMDFEDVITINKKNEIANNYKQLEDNKIFFRNDAEIEMDFKIKEQNIILERYQLNMVKNYQTEMFVFL